MTGIKNLQNIVAGLAAVTLPLSIEDQVRVDRLCTTSVKRSADCCMRVSCTISGRRSARSRRPTLPPCMLTMLRRLRTSFRTRCTTRCSTSGTRCAGTVYRRPSTSAMRSAKPFWQQWNRRRNSGRLANYLTWTRDSPHVGVGRARPGSDRTGEDERGYTEES